MNELDQKIEQCENDLKSIQANLEELKEQKEQKWVVAIASGGYGDRFILNLSALDKNTKKWLCGCINNDNVWISLCKNGTMGASSFLQDGLTFYHGTKIIF